MFHQDASVETIKLFTIRLLVTDDTMTVTYGDGTVLLASRENPNIAFIKLQNHENKLEKIK